MIAIFKDQQVLSVVPEHGILIFANSDLNIFTERSDILLLIQINCGELI